jgi:hypothetical protein
MGVPTREVEEPGTLKRVAELARAWFERHLLDRQVQS